MRVFFSRLLEVLAGASQAQLRRQVQFLKAENEILRRRIAGHVRATPAERARLVRLGRPLGSAVRHLVTVVSPRTLARWMNTKKKRRHARPRGPGRPRTPEELRDLVLRIARQTDWGYTRILGELRKLGINRLSRSTVANILREAGLHRGPERGAATWDQFIAMHARTLWACDIVCRRVWTPRGLVDAFLAVFIHINSRRVVVSASTTRPDSAWIVEQTRKFVAAARGGGHPPGQVVHDRDTKLGAAFDAELARLGVTPVWTVLRCPDMNAHAERFIRSLQDECLDRFMAIGTRHLDHLAREHTDYYNAKRPHSSLGFRAPTGPPPTEDPRPIEATVVRCRERLGGLLKDYYRRAA